MKMKMKRHEIILSVLLTAVAACAVPLDEGVSEQESAHIEDACRSGDLIVRCDGFLDPQAADGYCALLCGEGGGWCWKFNSNSNYQGICQSGALP